MAKIINLSPFFKSEQQDKSRFLLCKYAYKYGERSYSSQCLLTLKTFFQKEKRYASLFWDKKRSLPILKYKQLRILGEQAIEHYLLQFKKYIKVSYEKARPELSFPSELKARQVPQANWQDHRQSKRSFLSLTCGLFILFSFFSFTKAQFAQADSENIKKSANFSDRIGSRPDHTKDIGSKEANIAKKKSKEYLEALELYLEADFQFSLEKIRSVFEEYKDDMGLRLLAAANYIALGENSRAMSHVQAAKRKHPKRFEPTLFYARVLRSQKKRYKAIALLRRAMRNFGKQPGLLLEMAALYYELKDYPRVRTQLQKVLELEPQNYYAFYLDGLLFLRERRYELAEFRLRNALALEPKHKEDLKLLYNNLALAIEKRGEELEKEAKMKEAKQNYKEAKLYYNLASKIEPQNQLIRSNKERVELR